MENGGEIFHTALEEEILREEDDHPDVVPPFNAYSVAGEPEVGYVLKFWGSNWDCRDLDLRL